MTRLVRQKGAHAVRRTCTTVLRVVAGEAVHCGRSAPWRLEREGEPAERLCENHAAATASRLSLVLYDEYGHRVAIG